MSIIWIVESAHYMLLVKNNKNNTSVTQFPLFPVKPQYV